MLLVAAILAILLVALIVLLLAKTGGSDQCNAEENQFSTFCIERSFGPDHAIIWDTQTPALEMIASGGELGLPMQRLHLFYARSCRLYPELYDGSTFASWLDFLKRNELIEVNAGIVSLRTEGWEFLHYRVPSKAGEPVPWARR